MRSRPCNVGAWLAIWLCGQSGCVQLNSVAAATQRAETLAFASGLERASIATATFAITTFARVTAQDRPLHVYFEGDGRAWQSRSVPADDPTPRRALGLQLAARDTSANVVYIARPCEFAAAMARAR